MSTRTIISALLLIILAPACALDVDLAVTLDRDGAGEIVLTLQADAAALDTARQAGADPLAGLEEDLREAGGWDVTRTTGEDGSGTVELRRGFADPEELQAVTSELAAQLDQPELRAVEPFALSVSEEQLTLSGGAGLALTDAAVAGLATTVEAAEQQLADTVDYTVSVTFPAAVMTTTPQAELSRDAAGEGPTTASWTIAPGEQVILTATAERPPPSRLWVVVGFAAGGALLGLVVGAVVWQRVRRP